MTTQLPTFKRHSFFFYNFFIISCTYFLDAPEVKTQINQCESSLCQSRTTFGVSHWREVSGHTISQCYGEYSRSRLERPGNLLDSNVTLVCPQESLQLRNRNLGFSEIAQRIPVFDDHSAPCQNDCQELFLKEADVDSSCRR